MIIWQRIVDTPTKSTRSCGLTHIPRVEIISEIVCEAIPRACRLTHIARIPHPPGRHITKRILRYEPGIGPRIRILIIGILRGVNIVSPSHAIRGVIGRLVALMHMALERWR